MCAIGVLSIRSSIISVLDPLVSVKISAVYGYGSSKYCDSYVVPGIPVLAKVLD